MNHLTGRPDGYVELTLDIATLCTNYTNSRQAVILFEVVGGTNGRYLVHAGEVDYNNERDLEAGPALSQDLVVTEFYGEALRKARAWCGWDWDPHPDKPKDLP